MLAGTEIPGLGAGGGGGRGRDGRGGQVFVCVCVGGGGVRYLTLHCDLQNEFRIEMDNDESRFNVSLIVRGKTTRQCPISTTVEEKRETKRRMEPTSSLTSL